MKRLVFTRIRNISFIVKGSSADRMLYRADRSWFGWWEDRVLISWLSFPNDA